VISGFLATLSCYSAVMRADFGAFVARKRYRLI
jgi:hypothetical protein